MIQLSTPGAIQRESKESLESQERMVELHTSISSIPMMAVCRLLLAMERSLVAT